MKGLPHPFLSSLPISFILALSELKVFTESILPKHMVHILFAQQEGKWFG